MKRLIRVNLGWLLWVILLSLLVAFPLMSSIVKAPIEESEGNISFMPNMIPFLEIHFVEEFFRFQWNANRFDLKLLIAHNDSGIIKELSIRDFWEKTDRVVKWENLSNRATESMYEFGYNITDIPPAIADNVEYLVWKIESASFDVSEIEVEVITDTLIDFGYNVTRFYLPDNLVLSYEDLWLYNFTVTHLNKLDTKIEGVKGKSSWNLDPIVYSSGIITITGFSTEATGADHEDIYTSIANTTISSKQDTKQYSFGYARIVIGDGENTTWFVALDQQVAFNTSCFSANSQSVYEIKANSHLRFGVVVDESDKTTRNGVSINVYAGSYNYINTINALTDSTAQIYSSIFDTDSIGSRERHIGALNVTIYNSILNGHDLTFFNASGEIYNVISYRPRYGAVTSTAPIEDFMVYNSWGFPAYGAVLQVWLTTLTARNVLARDNLIFFRGFVTLDCYIINADVDSWVFSFAGGSAEAYRQYEFDLNVTDSANSPIQNANVTLSHYGEGASKDFSILTGANGSFATQTLTMGFYNQTGGNALYDYNDYNIRITHDDYAIKSFNFTLQEQIKWQISLDTSSYSIGIGSGFILAFMICTVLGLAGLYKIKKR